MGMRVGVIGGGQLAWMMAGAAAALGIKLIVQTPQSSDPAVRIADDVILAAIDDAEATAKLADRCDVITFENEFVDLEALRPLEQRGLRFYPQLAALAPLLDKYHQRCFLRDIGLPVPSFAAIEPNLGSAVSAADRAALSQFGFPVVLKTRRHGYDGQGTYILRSPADLEALLPQLQQPLLLEEFVPFDRELAVMVARSSSGEIITYPVVETQQPDQVCRRVLVTSDLAIEVQQSVEAIARQFVDSLQAVGIFGIELFLTAEGRVLVNEVAPRTHNSGHFTLDACLTSQFEQQLRAICGLRLGGTQLQAKGAVMVNLLGYESSTSDYLAQRQQLAKLPQTFVHWYGKVESRPGRKLGHVTALLDTADRSRAIELAAAIESIWYPG
jgi:5-(carboxyamino)imidazole ribonucleotide synthase